MVSAKLPNLIITRGKTNPPKPGSIRIRRGSVRIFEDPWIRGSKKKKKKSPALLACMMSRSLNSCHGAWTLRDRLRDDARLSQAYRYIAGANLWLQKVASVQQIAESLDDVFSVSSFRNAQWNQWLSLKVQVQPVLRSVLACGRSLRFRQSKKQPVCRLC